MKALSAFDIETFLLKFPFLKHHCEGISLSSSKKDLQLKEGNFQFVLFTNNDHKVGHWNVVLLNNGVIEHFDPLGYDAEIHQPFFKKFRNNIAIVSNLSRYQKGHEPLCGHFSLFLFSIELSHYMKTTLRSWKSTFHTTIYLN